MPAEFDDSVLSMAPTHHQKPKRSKSLSIGIDRLSKIAAQYLPIG
jgi:hypothetical protein